MKNTIVLLFLAAFVACGKTETTTEETTQKTNPKELTITRQQFENENMKIGSLVDHHFKSVVQANGMIDVPPENRALVNTYVGGYISKIPLLVGDYVKKGQFVATLTNTEFVEIQQKYLEIHAQLKYLKSEYERQQTLFQEKIASEKNFLKAEGTYKSTLAQFNGLAKKLEMMNLNPKEIQEGKLQTSISIYAPIDGFITEVFVTNGSFVSADSKLMEIVNTKHIHLELNVFEKDVLKLKKEQKILFKIPEASEELYNASVHLVGTTINSDRTVKVHGHLHDEDQKFITGMFVEATIIIKDTKSRALPNSAVFSEEGKSFVYIVMQEKSDAILIEKQAIQLGKKDEEASEIMNFQQFEGKKIIVNGAYMI